MCQTADGLAWQPIAVGGWGNSNNSMAAYFDKPITLFRGNLYIGTLNMVDGGQVWRRLRLAHLPIVLRNHTQD